MLGFSFYTNDTGDCAGLPRPGAVTLSPVSTPTIQDPDAGAVTRHLTRVGGVHLHWAEAGRGRPTILLHGVCDSHRAWRKVVPGLSLTRRLLMPDLPGHGLSDRPDAPYTVGWYGWMVGAWIDALGLRSFDLVGHSFGGGVAQMLLLSHAGRIDRLALVGSGGLGQEVTFALRLWSALRAAERLAQPFVAHGTRLALASLLPGSDPEDVAFMSWMNAMPGTGRALSRTVRSAIDWKGQKLQLFDRAAELPSLLPRMALFWGSRDKIIPVEHAQALVARTEHVTLTQFDDCGHWPQLEQPEAFTLALASFLGEPAPERARFRDATKAPPLPGWKRRLRALWQWFRRVLSSLHAEWSRRRLPPP
jgi:pimeloyl-ACP methyl ester carboxylesterase